MAEGGPSRNFDSGGEPAVRSDQSPRPGGRVGRSAGRRGQDVPPPSLAPGRAAGRPLESPSVGAAREPERGTALPAQTTRLIGREWEVARVRALLLQADVRLVTLVGPPGIGKTRLALALAEAAEDTFADGVAFVPLAPLREPGLVVSAIAQPVGVRELGGRPLLETLVAALSRRHLLLVLDNFEHLPDAAGVVGDLLAACPELKVLATSRAPLRVYGEREAPVPPLGLPDPIRPTEPDALAELPAVALFLERARAVRPDFGLSVGNAAVVAEICRRLDGLPLAIELAAARVKLLAPAVILARLERRLDLLADGPRDAPSRQRTLRAAIDWSHDLLSEPERALLRRSAVFAGGWTLEAAEAVCAGSGIEAGDILGLLASLVDKSLVQGEERGGQVRYRLLETIRQYAEAKLCESGEEPAWRTRHLDWFVALAEEAEPRLCGPEQVAWLDRLEAEHDNLRVALATAQHAAECRDGTLPEDGGRWAAEAGLRLFAALYRFWIVRGHLNEGRQWLAGLLPRASAGSAARASALWVGATLALFQGDYLAAYTLGEEGVALARDVGDSLGAIASYMMLGGALLRRGDLARAVEAADESLVLAREAGSKLYLSYALYARVEVARAAGDGRADAWLHEGLALARQIGDVWGLCSWLLGAGQLAWLRGQYDRAAALLREDLRLWDELGSPSGIAMALETLAWVTGAQGLTARAARLFGAAAAAREAVGTAVFPAGRADQARAEAAARADLGDAAFEAAWAAGQAMPRQQAFEYALAADEPLTTGTAPQEDAAGSRSPDPLTPREREVAVLVARGLTNRQIAEALVISERTADTHVGNILGKLGLATRAQVAVWAVEQGLTATHPE